MSDEHERPENDETGAPEGQEDLTRRSLPSRPGGPTTMRFRGLGEIPEAFDPDGGSLPRMRRPSVRCDTERPCSSLSGGPTTGLVSFSTTPR